MNFFDLILISLIQGITEWLPISSTGQGMLVLMGPLDFEPEQALAIILWLHLGTLGAVCCKFWRQIFNLIKAVPGLIKKIVRTTNKNLSETETICQFLIHTTFFSFLVGVPLYFGFKEFLPTIDMEITTLIIGFFLIITGVVLKKSKEFSFKNKEKISKYDSLLAGIAQGFSVLPGISRSGIVLATLLGKRFKQKHALELCFLMAVPVMFFGFIGAIIFQELEWNFGLKYLIIGNIVSFLSGFLLIDLLLRLAGKINFGNFCIFIGIISFLPFISLLLH